jgi:orotate phosphoribosyltransferase
MYIFYGRVMNRIELAHALYHISHLTGTFVLRSGAVSHEYFDKYLFESNPALLREIAAHWQTMIPADTEILAGLEMGGIPLATALSLASGLPVSFVRKKAKEYGTRNIAEGALVQGKNILMIEDVITSGGQVIESAKELRHAGANILGVLCVIDREAGGAEKLHNEGLHLHALFTMTELKAQA